MNWILTIQEGGGALLDLPWGGQRNLGHLSLGSVDGEELTIGKAGRPLTAKAQGHQEDQALVLWL